MPAIDALQQSVIAKLEPGETLRGLLVHSPPNDPMSILPVVFGVVFLQVSRAGANWNFLGAIVAGGAGGLFGGLIVRLIQKRRERVGNLSKLAASLTSPRAVAVTDRRIAVFAMATRQAGSLIADRLTTTITHAVALAPQKGVVPITVSFNDHPDLTLRANTKIMASQIGPFVAALNQPPA